MRIMSIPFALCTVALLGLPACAGDDSGSSDPTSGTSSDAGGTDDGSTSLSPETDDGGDSSAGTPSPGEDDGPADETGSTGEPPGTDDGGETSGGAGLDIDPICVDWSEHAVKCGVTDMPEGEAATCQDFLHPMPGSPGDTPECIEANAAYYACLTAASCRALTEPGSKACAAETDAAFNCAT